MHDERADLPGFLSGAFSAGLILIVSAMVWVSFITVRLCNRAGGCAHAFACVSAVPPFDDFAGLLSGRASYRTAGSYLSILRPPDSWVIRMSQPLPVCFVSKSLASSRVALDFCVVEVTVFACLYLMVAVLDWNIPSYRCRWPRPCECQEILSEHSGVFCVFV